MGTSRFGATDWASYAKTASAASTARNAKEFYKSSSLSKTLDPKGVKIRESRDSDINPNSTAVILALDVTGSMGNIAHEIAKNGLGVILKEIYDRKPVTDPHLMFMGIGDATCDSAPLQASQFEADIRIVEQLTQLYVEGGGGGNRSESYDFPWYFAAQHTSIDCWEKRKKKGYLFTFGDEEAPYGLTKGQIKQFLDEDVQGNYTAQQLLEMAERTYNVFHIIIGEGDHCQRFSSEVKKTWANLLGQRAIWLDDFTKLGELVISTIQVNEGASVKDVAASWDGTTGLVIAKSLNALATKDVSTGVTAI